jgi:hypothetical protein
MCAETDEEARHRAEGWTFFVFCLDYNRTHRYEPGTVDLWGEYQDWVKAGKAAAIFQTGLIGSPETIRKKLRAFADANLDQIILLTQAGKNRHEDVCESLELFAREVMPEFHALEPEHQSWKSGVLAGTIALEDLDVSSHQRERDLVVKPTPARVDQSS